MTLSDLQGNSSYFEHYIGNMPRRGEFIDLIVAICNVRPQVTSFCVEVLVVRKWGSNGVGRMGKVQGAPSAGAPEFQAKKIKKQFSRYSEN